MKTALVLVANGSEELETVTVVDVLRRAKIKVLLVAVDPPESETLSHVVGCSNGIRIVADAHLSSLGDKEVSE